LLERVTAGMLAALAGCASQNTTPASGNASLGSLNQLPVDPSRSEEHAEASSAIATTREVWHFAEHAGSLITTPHYRLYTTVEDEAFLDHLPRFYERALAHYTTSLARLPKPSVPVPLETFLFRTRGQWQIKTQEILPEQSRMFSNLGRGGYTTKGTAVLYYIDRSDYARDTLAIAAHEGWHQYTQRTFKRAQRAGVHARRELRAPRDAARRGPR
jgi:hypothetical protein